MDDYCTAKCRPAFVTSSFKQIIDRIFYRLSAGSMSRVFEELVIYAFIGSGYHLFHSFVSFRNIIRCRWLTGRPKIFSNLYVTCMRDDYVKLKASCSMAYGTVSLYGYRCHAKYCQHANPHLRQSTIQRSSCSPFTLRAPIKTKMICCKPGLTDSHKCIIAMWSLWCYGCTTYGHIWEAIRLDFCQTLPCDAALAVHVESHLTGSLVCNLAMQYIICNRRHFKAVILNLS